MREQRRLGITSGGELIGRTLEAQSTQIGAERGIDFTEDSFGHWE